MNWPIEGNDVMIKSGVSFNIYTLLHCITGMRQYENKSLEVSKNGQMDK